MAFTILISFSTVPVLISTKLLSDKNLPPITCHILSFKEGSLAEGK